MQTSSSMDQLARRPYEDDDKRQLGDDTFRKIVASDVYREGSALPASAPETSRTNIGKVRQLFEERRKQQIRVRRPLQTAAVGRDKSYPLQPIRRNKPEIGDDASVDEITQPVIVYDSSIFGRLPNLGGRLLSDKTKPTAGGETNSNFTQSADMSAAARRNVNSSVTKVTEDMSRLSTGRSLVNGVLKKPVVVVNRQIPSPKQGTVQPIGKSTKSTAVANRLSDDRLGTSNDIDRARLTAADRKPLASREVKKPIPSLTSPTKKKPLTNGTIKMPSKSTAAAAVKKPSQPPPPGMVNCKTCGRNFAQDRIKKHQEICEKASKSKRKKFDPLKQRLKGTEAEGYINQIKSTKKISEPPKKDTWRKQHEEFINNIRAARMVKQHLAQGGKLSDLPPPPPSDTSDYVPCPHCGRKFNDAAAARHIPKCVTMRHNKPKNVPANRSDPSKIKKINATRKR
ncbi:zinc finger C2HC domain-containing protein 1C isoform X2 [Planococcus citri]|uniref:zinc finger C2HC domain-containing protein 1C isoform X2 n=1 Tax=Planococcus citri TaxID=170843 RepID=UPI0031F84F6D